MLHNHALPSLFKNVQCAAFLLVLQLHSLLQIYCQLISVAENSRTDLMFTQGLLLTVITIVLVWQVTPHMSITDTPEYAHLMSVQQYINSMSNALTT